MVEKKAHWEYVEKYFRKIKNKQSILQFHLQIQIYKYMIKKFDTFNDAKLVQGDLLEDVRMISLQQMKILILEYPIKELLSQKSQCFDSYIISPSRKYTIEEYANLQDKWNEIVQGHEARYSTINR